MSPNSAVLLNSKSLFELQLSLPLGSYQSHQPYFWMEQKVASGKETTVHELHRVETLLEKPTF